MPSFSGNQAPVGALEIEGKTVATSTGGSIDMNSPESKVS